MARLLGYSITSIDRLANDGLPKPVEGGGRGRPTRYDLEACLQWQRERRRSVTSKDKLNLKQIEKLDVELAQRRNELLPRAHVEITITSLLTHARAGFQGLGVYTRQKHADCPVAVVATITNRVDELLHDLADALDGVVPSVVPAPDVEEEAPHA